MDDKHLNTLLQIIKESVRNNDLKKITLSGLRMDADEIKTIIKPVMLKDKLHLQHVEHHSQKVITKNHNLEDSLKMIQNYLTRKYLYATVVTLDRIHQYDGKKNRIFRSKTQTAAPVQLDHDRSKKYLVPLTAPYLHALGITTKESDLKKNKRDKFLQINKFIELLDPTLKKMSSEKLSVMDMGSGKGYLTFALYQHLYESVESLTMKGVEFRPHLVDQCNKIANRCDYRGLSFISGKIEDQNEQELDLLIALHACDTATDDAIAYGVEQNANCIVCSPCCHKQVRRSMSKSTSLDAIYQHGILQERQAEILTDTIRMLALNYHGYRTKIVEFISGEHTAKNLMIIAERTNIDNDPKALIEIRDLKKIFGIEYHYIERILPTEKAI